MAQDGTPWVGTLSEGVSHYDGERWVAYTSADGLADDAVTSIATTPDGTLCFGTENGISCFDGGAWNTYTTDGPADNAIPKVAVAPDGVVWVGTGTMGRFASGRGVSRFDGTWTSYTTKDGLAHDIVNTIAVGPDGVVWAGAGDPSEAGFGVSRFDGQTWTTYTQEDGLVSDGVTSIAVAPDGTVWIGTYEGLSHFDGKATWTTYLEGKTIGSAAVMPDGTLWFGASYWVGSDQRYSVYRFDPASSSTDTEAWNTYRVENPVTSVALGPDGALWLGSYGGGVLRFEEQAVSGETGTVFTVDDGLVSNYVFSIAIAPDGAVWIGTYDGVSRFHGGNWVTYTKDDGLADDHVQSIAVSPDGALWFGAASGVSRYLPSD